MFQDSLSLLPTAQDYRQLFWTLHVTTDEGCQSNPSNSSKKAAVKPGEILTSQESYARQQLAEEEKQEKEKKREENKKTRLQDQSRRWETRIEEVYTCFRWAAQVGYDINI